MKYTFKEGRHAPVKADVLGNELARIQKKNGDLTPRAVVDESKPVKAPLHKCFEWQDAKAADNWRVHQARMLINVVEVVPAKSKAKQPVQAFVNVLASEDREERSYVPIDDVLANPEERAKLVARAMEKLLRVQREFRMLRELEVVWNAIESLATEAV